MGASRLYFFLFISVCFLNPCRPLRAQMSILPQQDWLLTDTLDLPLSDPSYEVAFFKDHILFLTSAFKGMGKVPMEDPDLSRREPLPVLNSFPFYPSAISFTGNYERCYATGSKKVWDNFSLEKILDLSMVQGKTSDLYPLSFTVDSCRYLHPALAANDSLMIFSSDRLPNRGGLDLFVSRLDSNGWSQPKNLGPSINSSGHERYAFLDKENNLWFASTGHKGYGAYDLYVCPFNGLAWEEPQNLGPSINTTEDEIGFSIHKGAQAALFTRKSSSGGMALRLITKDNADYSIILVLINQANPPSPQEDSTVIESDPDKKPKMLPPASSEEPMQDPEPDPDRLLFRVQILSSAREGSTPTVVIDGQEYPTYEYLYKGSYRITVGEFEKVEGANKFRLRCKQAGYNQAFVAAFRGNKRETDPSVFKKQ